ncbi:MAG TPA: metal-dependent hydrolase [Ohtaekwangia sp.]|uniref:metal-dependent hydrolase n=1 Tax=Ohtaekwangia sp. TaxID=2066019 RepID=UPI002F935F96
MDSLTHIAIGAVIGDAWLGKRLGKKAMLIGAVAQSLPDMDFVASLWMSPAEYLLAHRGFTHSICFALLSGFVLASTAVRWKKEIGLSAWMLFFTVQCLLHLAIDILNVYGVGLWEPVLHNRYSLNLLFVADPLFTAWPFIAMIVLFFLKQEHVLRIHWRWFAALSCTMYIAIVVLIKLYITQAVATDLQQLAIEPARYFTTPTPLNSLLWYTVVEREGGYLIGYKSVWDKGPGIYIAVYRQEELLSAIADRDDVLRLKQFSQDYYIVYKARDALLFSDLRFGQVFGWADPKASFIFQYDLLHPESNLLVLQRGRFSGWNRAEVKTLFNRIRGKQNRQVSE